VPYRITTLADFAQHGFDAVIDVRSPAEYAEDHLPGAISLPALSDAERAEVGTIYKQESPFRARKIGAAMVARNVAAHLEGPLSEMDGGWRPLVYCWRGGQRSGSVATILREVGWRVETVEGGYRSFRRAVVAALYDAACPSPVVLLDGNTGTAKTDRAGPVEDARGAGDRPRRPGAAPGVAPWGDAGRSAVAEGLRDGAGDGGGRARSRPARGDRGRSSKVGDLIVPPVVWKAMIEAPRIEIAVPVPARAEYLARAYADLTADAGGLAATLGTLRQMQGAERVEAWQRLAVDGQFEALAAELCAHHYDPRYEKHRARWERAPLARLEAARLDAAGVEVLAEGVLSALR
jgi:tRNA 2-selenouridine synthase